MTIKRNQPSGQITPSNSQSNPSNTSPHYSPLHSNTTSTPYGESKKRLHTRITVKFDVGYNNTLYIRGKGANLSWDHGTPLKNVAPDEWVWETDAPFTQCEFKILINDHQFEQGENHLLTVGKSVQFTPFF